MNEPSEIIDSPFEGLSMEEVFERLRWDGSLGGKPVRLSSVTLARRASHCKAKQKAAKAARKRNRR